MSSDNVEMLARALEWQPEDMERVRRVHQCNALARLIFYLTFAAWIIAEEVNNILEAQRTGDWYLALGIHFAGQIASQLIFGAFLYSMFRYAPQIRQPQIEAALLALRAAAAHPQAELAPEATKVMEGLAHEQVPNLPISVQGLRRPGRQFPSSVAMFMYMVLYSGIIVLLGSVGILLFYSARTGYLWIIALILGVLLTATGIGLLVWNGRRSRGISVTADESGLHWKLPGGRRGDRDRFISWEHARAFYPVGYLNEDAEQQWAVTLDAPGASLSWEISPMLKAASLAASDQLGALILARTGIPLRDLTATAQKLMVEPWRRHYPQTQEALRAFIPLVATLYAALPSTTWRREARPAAYIMSLALLVCAVLYGIALVVLHFSP